MLGPKLEPSSSHPPTLFLGGRFSYKDADNNDIAVVHDYDDDTNDDNNYGTDHNGDIDHDTGYDEMPVMFSVVLRLPITMPRLLLTPVNLRITVE